MKNHRNKLPATDYLFPWLRHLLSRGYDIEPSLKRAGLEYTDLFLEQYAIPLTQYFTLIKDMENLVGRHTLIRECMDKTVITHPSLLALLAQCGPTLRDNSQALMRFQFLRARAIPLSLHEEGDKAIIRAHATLDLGDAEPFMMEIALRALLQGKQALVGTLGYKDSICLPYKKPCEHGIYDSIHPHAYLFEQEHYQLVFPREHFDLPLQPERQKALQAVAEQGCLSLQELNGKDTLTEKIQYLLSYCEPHFPSFEEMAQILNCSSRSLSRHLQQADTNYKYLVDDERVERIKTLLSKRSPQTLDTIAQHLDFSDPSHLSRVFKRHAGITPSQFRNNLPASTRRNSDNEAFE